MKNLSIIILAAGKGTRMKSSTHKVLNKIAGREMINMVVDTTKNLNPQNIFTVVSDDMNEVEKNIIENYSKAQFIIQKERKGTGHAVQVAVKEIQKKSELGDNVFIMCGDVPLIKKETLESMYEKVQKNEWAITVLAFHTKDTTTKYGRLITHKEEIEKIVEFKDATKEERETTLCNSGIIAVDGKALPKFLEKVNNNNASGEYYLTDIVEIARQMNLKSTFVEADEDEVIGVNSKVDLAEAELITQNRLRKYFMTEGVTIVDPQTVYFHYDTEIGKDVIIQPNVFFGKDVKIKNDVEIKAFTHIEGAEIEDGVSVGPFARIRPGTYLKKNSRVGNFVEVKKSEVGEGVKIGHLSYIGDSSIGENTNIGAGTITCNYDGVKKHKTRIGKSSFIGSNTALVAPVEVGEGAIIAAGSTITKNVAKDALGISRPEQVEIKDFAKKMHKK